MLLLLFTIVVYVFFIYGVIEFTKKVYLDIMSKGNRKRGPAIQVVVGEKNDLEYIIRNLRKDFCNIMVILDEGIEEVPKSINDIGKGVNIQYRQFEEYKKARGL